MSYNNKVAKKKASLAEVFTGIASGITGVYVFVILTVFPLYTHDMYFDILGARYIFFKVWGISLVALLVILGLIYFVLDKQNQSSNPPAVNRFFNSFRISNLKKHVIITDIFFVAMLLVCIISTIGSEFKEESFFGSSGRFQGLECWIVYFITYFAISRTFKFKRYILDFALISGCFACFWGILDFLWLDPFGFFKNVSDQQKGMFASSIGNLNTFTNYTVIIFAIAGVLFIIEKKPIRSIIYGLATIIGCCGCIFGLADNAVLGLFAFYLFVPFFVIKTRREVVRYLFTIDAMFITLFLFSIALKFPHNAYQSSFFQDLLRSSVFIYAFIPFTLIVVLVAFLLNKMKPNYGQVIDNNLKPLDSLLPNKFFTVYTVIVIIGFAFVTYILLDMNIFKKHVDIWNKIPSSHQLIFDDNWGTHRGHNWRIAFTNFFENFDLFKKLFGYGPDTYLVVSERTFYEEMVNRYGEVYDSAHNEYINYLICEGLFGLISYLGIFISGVYYSIKSSLKNKMILACSLAVICYLVQAIVNIAIPITTPIFFTLMYMGVAEYINKRKEDDLNININA